MLLLGTQNNAYNKRKYKKFVIFPKNNIYFFLIFVIDKNMIILLACACYFLFSMQYFVGVQLQIFYRKTLVIQKSM